MIRRNRNALLSAVVAGLGSAACAQSHPGVGSAADSLQLAHSMELQQLDSNFVARPYRMAIRSDRSVMISDIGRAVVWWFGPDGTLLRVIGRRGEGPGEFMRPGAIVALDDSTIAVHEYGKRILKVLRLPTGVELRTVTFDAVVPFGGISWRDTVWFGAMAVQRGSAAGSIAGVASLMRWPIGDSAATPQWTAPDGLSHNGLPTPLGGLASQVISVDSTGFWVKYGLRDVLERRARDGTLLGEWKIPAEHRRGVPAERIDFASKPSNWTAREFTNPFWIDVTFSSDRGFGQRRDGTLMLVTMDGIVEGKVLLGTFYGSVLDPLHNRACVDWVLPERSLAIPLTVVVGDSLVVLSQEIDSASTGRVHLMLRTFTLPTDQCRWQPMPKESPASH